MKYREIPRTDLSVSVIGLGTMTWGQQNSREEAFEQMNFALEKGVNLLDTAEMYPVPPGEDSCYETERIIGQWFKETQRRDEYILATKVVGPGPHVSHIRNGGGLDRENVRLALEGSLKRLQTDRIDLYQIHWPDRPVPLFGTRDYSPPKNDSSVPIEETLEALADFQKAGKIRYIGISNETPWGAMKYLELSKSSSLPEVVTIQNSYNLLNRTFDSGLSEICFHEGLRLLAYSPLGFGRLSGKYRNGNQPDPARLTLWKRFARYNGPNSDVAIEEYAKIAEKAGLSLATMSLAWVNSRFHVASTLVGATTIEQLAENIASADVELAGEVRHEIDKIHHRYPNPCP